MRHRKIKHYKTDNISDEQLWKMSIKHMKIRHCFYPNCNSTQIIKSHTLQNNGVISELSFNGHVCMPRISRSSTVPLDKNYGEKLQLVGKKQATVFEGFCKEHDDALFKDIEKKSWEPTSNVTFLFTYRTICSELQTKLEYLNRINYILKKRWITHDNMPDSLKIDYNLMKLAVSDLTRVKNECDNYLLGIRKNLPIDGINLKMRSSNFAVSGYYIPYYNFKGRLINRKFGNIDFPLFINIIPKKNTTVVFLTSLSDDYNRFYKSYLKDFKNLRNDKKEIFLTNLAIKCSDNLIINPKSANKLTNNQIRLIEGQQNSDDVAIETISQSNRILLEDKGLNLFDL